MDPAWWGSAVAWRWRMDHGCLFNGSSTKKMMTSSLPMAPPYPCQSCAAHDAIVFCPVDGARLCVFCDVDVHGASTLAGLHQRAPLCDSCGGAAAAMRCAATFMVCNDCQWLFKQHGPTRVDVTHYAGCPDPTELMRLLSVEAPAQQDEFDAWLHGLLLLDMDGTTATNSNSSGGGMCDVAIAAAKIDKLLAGYAAAAGGGGNDGSKEETDAAAAPPSGDDDHHQHVLFQPTNSLCTSNNGDKEQTDACCHTRQDPTNQQQKRADRERAKLRYMEKKKKRSFCKHIMYASRKQTADTRMRVKGRFVKASSSSSELHHDNVLNSDPQPATLGSI